MNISVRKIKCDISSIKPCIVCKEKFSIGDQTLVVRTSAGTTMRYCLYHGDKWLRQEIKQLQEVHIKVKGILKEQKEKEKEDGSN